MLLGNTARVSLDSAGSEANDDSQVPRISGDGRYISFQSWATNLVADDNNFREDVFVRDRGTSTTTRVSVDPTGAEGNGNSTNAGISADGRYVVIQTKADNLVPNMDSQDGVLVRAIPLVAVTSIVPDVLLIGNTSAVTITGTNFLSGATPILDDAEFSNVVIMDEYTILADVTVSLGSPAGLRGVSVGIPVTGPGAMAGAIGICHDCVSFSSPPGC